MTVDYQLNFRETLGYVADGAGQTAVLEDEMYPTTRDGITFGWEQIGVSQGRNRNNAVDPRLAGIHFAHEVGDVFRIDLPDTGEYEFHCAFGDEGFQSNWTDWDVKDSNDVRESYGGQLGPQADQFKDAAGTVHTGASDWVSNEQSIDLAFSTTIFRLQRNANNGNTVVAHLRLVQKPAVTSSDGLRLSFSPSSRLDFRL